MQIAHQKSSPMEQRQRLSDSIIWKLQRNYFERQGMQAWSAGVVPHHITNSPFIADAYARVIFGFLRDCHAASAKGDDSSSLALDFSQPAHIVELGSGSGRFAYLFLKKFLSISRNSVLRHIPIRYVMTDFSEGTLDYWRTHPGLRPFVAEGLLDFARLDVESAPEIELITSGEILSAGTLRNPLISVSNYLFDSIPQDSFLVSDGELFENLITLRTPGKKPNPDDPEILSRLEISYDNEIVNGNYYADQNWNRILLDYKQRLLNAAFLFPVASLQCIRNLLHLSAGRMLLLSGDRGFTDDEALLCGKGSPTMAMHGAFSMMVDYQIIGEYCRHLGGQALHPAHRAESLNISAFMFGDLSGGFVETRQAYAEAIEKFGPDD